MNLTYLDKYHFKFAYGTYLIPNELCEISIINALKNGYRTIDTAQLYKNQILVGKAIKKSYQIIPNLTREDIFIISKIHNEDQKKGTIRQAVQKIIAELDLNDTYIDCILLHSPVTDKYIDSWKQLIECQKEFNIKYIGVSNFGVEQIQKIIENPEIQHEKHKIPFINQFELHPRNHKHQKSIIDYCISKNIIVQSHSAIKPFLDFQKLGTKITLKDIFKWYCIHNYPTIVKSSNENNIQSNMELFKQGLKEIQELSSSQIKPYKNSFEIYDDDFFRFERFKFNNEI